MTKEQAKRIEEVLIEIRDILKQIFQGVVR